MTPAKNNKNNNHNRALQQNQPAMPLTDAFGDAANGGELVHRQESAPYAHAHGDRHGRQELQFPSDLPPYLDSSLISYEALKVSPYDVPQKAALAGWKKSLSLDDENKGWQTYVQERYENGGSKKMNGKLERGGCGG